MKYIGKEALTFVTVSCCEKRVTAARKSNSDVRFLFLASSTECRDSEQAKVDRMFPFGIYRWTKFSLCHAVIFFIAGM